MLLVVLVIIALSTTVTMFSKKEAMLGFPCAIFWALTGAQSYLLSTTPWGDLYFYLFFASAFGMTIFTMFAAFGLREKRDALGDEDDEGGVKQSDDDDIDVEDNGDGDTAFDEKRTQPSTRTQRLRDRARARRTGG